MMNKSKTLLSTMMGLLLFGAVACAQQSTTNAESTGAISLYFADGSHQCTFPAVTQKTHFITSPEPQGSACKPVLDGGYIKLHNVPSATRIWLVNGLHTSLYPYNPSECGYTGNARLGWWELKTIKEPTTLPEKLAINDLRTHQIGDVVVPGLVLAGQRHESNEPNRVNCLVVEVSP